MFVGTPCRWIEVSLAEGVVLIMTYFKRVTRCMKIFQFGERDLAALVREHSLWLFGRSTPSNSMGYTLSTDVQWVVLHVTILAAFSFHCCHSARMEFFDDSRTLLFTIFLCCQMQTLPRLWKEGVAFFTGFTLFFLFLFGRFCRGKMVSTVLSCWSAMLKRSKTSASSSKVNQKVKVGWPCLCHSRDRYRWRLSSGAFPRVHCCCCWECCSPVIEDSLCPTLTQRGMLQIKITQTPNGSVQLWKHVLKNLEQ